jgi:hypothetical protein
VRPVRCCFDADGQVGELCAHVCLAEDPYLLGLHGGLQAVLGRFVQLAGIRVLRRAASGQCHGQQRRHGQCGKDRRSFHLFPQVVSNPES